MKNHFGELFKFSLVLLIFFHLFACDKAADKMTIQPKQVGQGEAPPPTPAEAPCVQVFYDKTGENTNLSRSYALMIINLLGHFPVYQQIIGPVELYRKGDLEKCKASFYIGTEKENVLPVEFLSDFSKTSKTVVWMGHNFWQLGEAFEKTFGYKKYEFNNLDLANRTPAPENKPSFFRDILYKGEVFSKYNVWLKDKPDVLDGAFEMIKLSEKSGSQSFVLAQARHSFSNELIPWALQSGRKFYIAEIPLSYFHEADRYFVFADLLFDFLEEKPRHNGKYAFIRLEDVGPMEDLKYLQEASDIFARYQVTPHFNLYPIFRDPLKTEPSLGGRLELRIEQSPEFAAAIQKYVKNGAVIIWHGVTHQYSDLKNPWTGASGDDYEFWNAMTNSPLAEDSVNYILTKMEDGFSSLKNQKIEPKLWVTPHYEASALDNVLFGQLFSWMVSRGVYIDNKISGLKEKNPSKPIHFSLVNSEQTIRNRREYFANLKVEANPNVRFGQIFPYELYGDIFKQHIIPEDLGNVEPELNQQVEFVRTVDTILEDAKRNLVLRDVWASAFYHSFLLDPKLNKANQDAKQPKDLERLLSGLKSLGYNFVNLETWIKEREEISTKPRIELEEVRK